MIRSSWRWGRARGFLQDFIIHTNFLFENTFKVLNHVLYFHGKWRMCIINNLFNLQSSSRFCSSRICSSRIFWKVQFLAFHVPNLQFTKFFSILKGVFSAQSLSLIGFLKAVMQRSEALRDHLSRCTSLSTQLGWGRSCVIFAQFRKTNQKNWLVILYWILENKVERLKWVKS